jgi:predicted dehydrogenase
VSTQSFTIACIGLGRRLAKVVWELTRVAPQMRLLAFADPAPSGLERLQQHGIEPEAHGDAAAMLRAVRPDAVMIGSPNHLHLAHLQLALDSGARIFCEKPVVRTARETFALSARLASEPRDRVIVGLVLRSLPVVKESLALIQRGRLGTVTSFEANEHLHPEHGGFLRRDWRRRRAFAGSYLLDKCCHDLDLLNAVAGARPRRVASFAANRIFTRAHADLDTPPRYRNWPTGWPSGERIFDSDADTADVQTILLEYTNGVIGTFHTNSHVNPPRRAWFIAGMEASMDVDLRGARLQLHPARDGVAGEECRFDSGSVRDHHGADPAMARDLAAAWLENVAFPVTVQDALVAGLTAMAADTAAETGVVSDLAATWAKFDAACARRA